RDRIEQIARGVAEANKGNYHYSFNEGYPAVHNTGWSTDIVVQKASELLGGENVQLLDNPLMAGEDFAFSQQHFPGTFFFLGYGSQESGAVHSWQIGRASCRERAWFAEVGA